MLTYDEITLVEGVYLAIESGGISDEFAIELRDYIYKQNYEQYIYLQWLTNRWSFLKHNKDHMPERISLSYVISGYHDLPSPRFDDITQMNLAYFTE